MCFLNMLRKCAALNKTLSFHERILIALKENTIPNVHDVISSAFARKQSLQYVTSKVVEAVNGLYNPKCNEDSKDLALIILQLGGPGLLDICHRALHFPDTSTIYKMLKKCKPVVSSITTPMNKYVSNFTLNCDVDGPLGSASHYQVVPKFGYMLKIDETFIDRRIRWNPQDNQLYGFCYEHARTEDLSFTSYNQIENLKQKVDDGKIHMPKESMVIACSSNSKICKAQILAALPTCDKGEVEYQANLIQTLSSNFMEKYGTPFLNWSTDGDPARRQIFHSLMTYPVQESSVLYPVVSNLRLIDLNVGKHEETTNYDAKHIGKRLRNTMISGRFQIGDRALIQVNDIVAILQKTSNLSNISTDRMICVQDKQNVPLATQFLVLFCDAVQHRDEINTINLRVSQASDDLYLFNFVIKGILALFYDKDISIQEQLIRISTAAHILMVLKRNLKNFLPNQLYHDIQATFEDSYYCATKWKIYHPYEPLYLMLCSNDVIERMFGNIRMRYSQTSLDNLELINSARAMKACTETMMKHPSWTRKNRSVSQRLALDYSNPQDWIENKLILNDVDIVSVWNTGRAIAEQHLNSTKRHAGTKSDFASYYVSGFTFLKPCGKLIGINEIEVDFSAASVADMISTLPFENSSAESRNALHFEQTSADTPTTGTSYIDMFEDVSNQRYRYDCQIDVDGQYVYKATVVKHLLNNSSSTLSLSNDRLRKIQGLSKYPQNASTDTLDQDLHCGDPILVSVGNNNLRLAIIKTLKKANRTQKTLNVNQLQNQNVVVDVKLMALETYHNFYVWNGDDTGKKLTTAGPQCYAIKPELKDINGTIRFAFDKQLILDLQVGLTVSEQQTNAPAVCRASSSGNVVCKVGRCKKSVKLEKMRLHVGKHILKKEITGINICGFCGDDSCENTLNISSRGKKKSL